MALGELVWRWKAREAPESVFSLVTDKDFGLGDKQTLPGLVS